MSRVPNVIRQHSAGLRFLIVFTILVGVAYPLAMMGIAQVAFHHQANGSLVHYQGRVVGSSLLCQEFTDAKGAPLPQYFQPRPSNAANPESKTDYGCDAGFTGASNLGPDNPALVKLIQTRRAQVAKFNGVDPASVPPDAVTASGSGLDPASVPPDAVTASGSGSTRTSHRSTPTSR
jgi:K+-transporting ATPase ATPase C chain